MILTTTKQNEDEYQHAHPHNIKPSQYWKPRSWLQQEQPTG